METKLVILVDEHTGRPVSFHKPGTEPQVRDAQTLVSLSEDDIETILKKNRMMTLEEFKALPFGRVFASGEIENSPDGIYMTDHRRGDKLLWIAKKGNVDDWAVYCHWREKGEQYVREQGDKVKGRENILKLVPCADEVLARYRY